MRGQRDGIERKVWVLEIWSCAMFIFDCWSRLREVWYLGDFWIWVKEIWVKEIWFFMFGYLLRGY